MSTEPMHSAVPAQTVHTVPASRPFLSVENLVVHFPTSDGIVRATDGLSYGLERGKTLGIVGESGSGKSVSSSTILGLHRRMNAQVSGEIWLDGVELLGLPEHEMQQKRGSEIAMIFQDPLSALHPYFKIGDQISEAYRAHNSVSKKAARTRTIEMLARVGIPNPDRRVDDYPHQFSGGMRQRVMIAMALINDPALLIADEPTTALDVTVQAQILDLLQDLQREFNAALIMITHDLGVIAELADDVLVMYAGRAVEYGATRELLIHPAMPYTLGLIQSVPDVTSPVDRPLRPIPGNPPSLLNPPPGCAFQPRCVFAQNVPDHRCSKELPDLLPATGDDLTHLKRCHLTDSSVMYANVDAQGGRA